MSKKKVDEDETEAAEGGKGKLLMVVVALVLVVGGGGGYWFFLKPHKPATPQPGVVVALDDIQVNLQSDHYLKLGLALQATKKAPQDLDGSKALDQAIAVFSGRDMDDLNRSQYRARLKKVLVKRLNKVYEGEVMGVYFTDFVTQ